MSPRARKAYGLRAAAGVVGDGKRGRGSTRHRRRKQNRDGTVASRRHGGVARIVLSELPGVGPGDGDAGDAQSRAAIVRQRDNLRSAGHHHRFASK